MIGSYIAFGLLSLLAIIAGWLVFRFDSMVRATFSLLTSFLAVACLLLLLDSEFMFAITFLMMLGEMVIMALFMVAFMMNPAGLNPMNMVHQPRQAAAAGIMTFLTLAAAILTSDFPLTEQPPPADVK
jgi:NADH:ubiquinone oxidoreductase subunit 6 (subunit J)